jgi:hypothetical protein
MVSKAEVIVVLKSNPYVTLVNRYSALLPNVEKRNQVLARA